MFTFMGVVLDKAARVGPVDGCLHSTDKGLHLMALR
jgi:hypothetical protein